MRTLGTKPTLRFMLISTALLGAGTMLGQNPQLRTKNGKKFPTVVFTFVLWTADPSYYSIAVDSTGTATYQSAPDSVERTGVPYTIEFQVSDRTRRATFNLAQRLNYFGQSTDEFLGYPQNSSIKTLGYHDSRFHNRITYTSSSDPEVQELTSVFEEISETLEFGRRLAYFREHDKNALAAELKSMQTSVDRHRLREMEALAPVLDSIASDVALDPAIREQAKALLQRAREHV